MLLELNDKPFDRWILKSFAENNRDRGTMLDLGCGPGQTTGFMRSHDVQDLIGIDLTPNMVKKASENFPNIPFQEGNFLALKHEDLSIGSAIAFYAIVHLKEDMLKSAFKEIHRILKPGGEFLFCCHLGEDKLHRTDFLDHDVDITFYYFKTPVLFGALDQVGFEVIQAYERYPYIGKEHPSKRAYIWVKK